MASPEPPRQAERHERTPDGRRPDPAAPDPPDSPAPAAPASAAPDRSAPLPPDPPRLLAGNLEALLSRADRAVGRLDGSILMLRHPDHFLAMYTRREAVLSSQIAGNPSSLHDVLAAEADGPSADLPEEVTQVLDYVRAMDHGLRRLRDLPVCVRLIRELHEELLRAPADATDGPSPRRNGPREAPRPLDDLERFLREDPSLPPLIRIGLAHARFETLHPFERGSGRVGRMLITVLLCGEGVLVKPVLYLSHYFRRHREACHDHIRAVRDRADWEGWLAFFLSGVIEVSRHATDTARELQALGERHRRILTDELGRAASNGHRVLEHLYGHPIVAVNDVQELLQNTYPAANNLVHRLVEHGILEEITGQRRHRRFRYAEYVDLFDDAPASEAP